MDEETTKRIAKYRKYEAKANLTDAIGQAISKFLEDKHLDTDDIVNVLERLADSWRDL